MLTEVYTNEIFLVRNLLFPTDSNLLVVLKYKKDEENFVLVCTKESQKS